MADCEKLKTCPFFNDMLPDMEHMSNLLKKKYCLADKQPCARYQVAVVLGSPKVPMDLYPHQVDRAVAILQSAKETGNP